VTKEPPKRKAGSQEQAAFNGNGFLIPNGPWFRDLDAGAVSLEAVLGGRNVQSCDGYPAGPAPIMVEVFSGKDER
jgi:hypothetical protein